MAKSYSEAVYKENKEFYKRIIDFIGSNKDNLEHNQEGQEIILELRRKINYLNFRIREEQKKTRRVLKTIGLSTQNFIRQ